jgi:2-iminobutanoate/2-iminopropanoate deaminase
MKLKKIINTSDAPAPIGPYSQAVHTGNLLFMSGQVAINPKTGELVLDSIEAETKQVMENLRSLLIPVAGSFDDVVMATIYLSDMSHFNEVNVVYGSYFKEGSYPARATIAVKALPKSVNVEISLIVAVRESSFNW